MLKPNLLYINTLIQCNYKQATLIKNDSNINQDLTILSPILPCPNLNIESGRYAIDKATRFVRWMDAELDLKME